ncbi:MAG: hypothetical protein ACJ75B_10300 [Flavisolibacter sp.]
MKKILILLTFCFFASKGFAQTTDVSTEEKSSAWVKVSNVKKTSSHEKTEKKKSQPSQKPASASDEFNSTNNKVKRFQKKG